MSLSHRRRLQLRVRGTNQIQMRIGYTENLTAEQGESDARSDVLNQILDTPRIGWEPKIAQLVLQAEEEITPMTEYGISYKVTCNRMLDALREETNRTLLEGKREQVEEDCLSVHISTLRQWHEMASAMSMPRMPYRGEEPEQRCKAYALTLDEQIKSAQALELKIRQTLVDSE